MKTIIYITFDYNSGYPFSVVFSPTCNLDLRVGEHFGDLHPVGFTEDGVPVVDYTIDQTTNYLYESDFGLSDAFHLRVRHVSKVCNQGKPFEIVHEKVDLVGTHSAICDYEKEEADYEKSIFWTIMYLSLQFGVTAFIRVPDRIDIPQWFSPTFGFAKVDDPIIAAFES